MSSLPPIEETRGINSVAGTLRAQHSREVITARPLHLPDPLPTEGPLVSVLIPLYNHERYIGESLRSVLLQTYRSIEVVVVDDCSTDRSLEVARDAAGGDPRVAFHQNRRNLGVVDNEGRLLELSNGPLVKFLAADDRFCMPDALARMVAAIESEPGISLVTSRWGWIDENGDALPEQWQSISASCDFVIDGMELGNLSLMRCNNYIGGAQVFQRRCSYDIDDWLKLDGHDTGLGIHSDLAMHLKLLVHGNAAYLKDETVQTRHFSTEQLTTTAYRNPQCIVIWYAVMKAARLAGYLAEPWMYRQALASLLGDHLHFERYTSSDLEDWEWMSEVIQMVAREIGELNRGIALGEINREAARIR